MAQDGMNKTLRLVLGSPDLTDGLIYMIKHANKPGDPEWSSKWTAWLDQLRVDAGFLLDQIDDEKESMKHDGKTKSEIAEYVEYLRSSVKPNKKLCRQLRSALGEYQLDTVVEFDADNCKLIRTDKHSASATNDQLVSVILCAAIGRGNWRFLRRCREPKCEQYFFDHMPSGGRVKHYCCEKHGAAHRARLRRGSE